MSERHDNDCGCEACRMRPTMSEPLTDEELQNLVDGSFDGDTTLAVQAVAEIRELRDEVEGLREQCREYGQVNTQFAEEKTKLREYIRHETTCPKDYCVSPDGAICTCGLDAALKRAENA